MLHVGDGYLLEGNTRVSQLTAVIDTLLGVMPCCHLVNVIINKQSIYEIIQTK